MTQKVPPIVLVHGGAAGLPAHEWADSMSGVRKAREAAISCLHKGGSAEQAAEAAIMLMEAHPLFDAGYDSHLDQRGKVVLDAAMVRGDLAVGAIAGVEHLAHPIQAARLLMNDPDLVMLFGAGAEAYANEQGLPLIENKALVSEREQRRFEGFVKQGHPGTMSAFLAQEKQKRMRTGDTVGAVIRDTEGTLIAANSTGGTPYKRPGRIGDTPLPGCGAIAEVGRGAVVCTGWGEAIVRLTLAQRVLAAIQERGAQAAAEWGVGLLAEALDAEGGVLCIGPTGEAGIAFNTTHMPWAALFCDEQEADADTLDRHITFMDPRSSMDSPQTPS